MLIIRTESGRDHGPVAAMNIAAIALASAALVPMHQNRGEWLVCDGFGKPESLAGRVKYPPEFDLGRVLSLGLPETGTACMPFPVAP